MAYFNRKTACSNGHSHPSAKEARRCNDLHVMQRAGLIAGLRYEPRFHFHVNGREVKMRNGQVASYRPDFTYIASGKQIAEEVKAKNGYVKEASALRMALFRACYPDIELKVVA